MKQRVGIARALAMKPKVLLMDEPFGALDALTRAHLQDSVMQIQQALNTTIVLITHDVDEAVLLSDRVLMMTNGPAATVGEILDVNLQRPAIGFCWRTTVVTTICVSRSCISSTKNSRKRRKGGPMRKLVMIGNGMAATRLAEKLVAMAPGMFAITIIGDEPRPAYNRIQLSPVLGARKRSIRRGCCLRAGMPNTGLPCVTARRFSRSIWRHGRCVPPRVRWHGMSWFSPAAHRRFCHRCRGSICRTFLPFGLSQTLRRFWPRRVMRW